MIIINGNFVYEHGRDLTWDIPLVVKYTKCIYIPNIFSVNMGAYSDKYGIYSQMRPGTGRRPCPCWQLRNGIDTFPGAINGAFHGHGGTSK